MIVGPAAVYEVIEVDDDIEKRFENPTYRKVVTIIRMIFILKATYRIIVVYIQGFANSMISRRSNDQVIE